MTSVQITKAVALAKSKMAEASRLMTIAELELKLARSQCPHAKRDSWTNNDGDGQFKVERCRVCGLQQDGGLG